MRVFYYTACPTGKRADDPRGGFGVRAWTAGSTKAQLEGAIRLAGCDFPPGGHTHRLAFVRRDGLTALFRSVPAAVDEVNRTGAPFTHAVTDLPSDFDPLTAIRTWDSPDWQSSYPPDADTVLPDPPAVPQPGPLTDSGLVAFLADPKNREAARYALSAALAPNPPAKTFVYAPAEVVAWTVYAVLRAAPDGVGREFTFSTYEKNLLDFPTRLVGNWGDTRENDLPRSCYQAPNAAINIVTLRADVKFVSVYAELALQWLAQGTPDRVGTFLARAEGLGVTGGTSLGDLAILFHAPERLDPDIVTRLLAEARTAGEVVASSDATAAVLRWAADPTNPRADLLATLVRTAGPGPAREAIVSRLEQDVLAAAAEPTPARMLRALALLGQIDSPRERRFGQTAVEQLDPATVPWPNRKEVLTRIRDAFRAEAEAPSKRIEAWLGVDQAQLSELLGLGLPSAWTVHAVAGVARREPLKNATVVKWLTDRPDQIRAVARALEPTIDPVGPLASVFSTAPLRELFRVFEANGGAVPAPVVDRVLDDRKFARELLTHRAILQRLKADPGALQRVVREALDELSSAPLLAPEFVKEVGAGAVAECANGYGWDALRGGRIQQANCAFTALPHLGGADPLNGFDTRTLGTLPAEAQWYLVRMVLARGKGDAEALVSWAPVLAGPLLGRLLIEPSAPENLKFRALQAYFTSQGQTPSELNGTQVPVSVVLRGLEWLLTQPPSGPVQARAVLAAQTNDRVREQELGTALFQKASSAPALWDLADHYLGLWLNKHPQSPAEGITRWGLPILQTAGLKPNVCALIEAILSRPEPFTKDGPEEAFFKEVKSAAGREKGPGPLTEGTLTHITYLLARLKRPAKGEDMLDWLLGLLGLSGSPRLNAQQVNEVTSAVGRSLLEPGAGPQLAVWLDKILRKNPQLFAGRAALLHAVFQWLIEQNQHNRFLQNTSAVVACLEVCLELPTAQGRAASGAKKVAAPAAARNAQAAGGVSLDALFDWLCQGLYQQNREYAFFELFRWTNNWTAESRTRLTQGYDRAKDARPGQPAAAKWAATPEPEPAQKKKSWWQWLWD